METVTLTNKKYEDVFEHAEKLRNAGYRIVRALRRGDFVTIFAYKPA